MLGAYFGYLLVWSRSLWLPVLIHAINNSLVVYSMWHTEGTSEAVEEVTINNWGVDSPTLILGSVILTVFIIVRLKKYSETDIENRECAS